MQTQDCTTGKKVWVRPEVTGTASLENAQANKNVTNQETPAGIGTTCGPAS